MSQLKIVAVGDLKTATDGRQYFGVDFSAGFGQKKSTRQMWEQFKRDSKTGLPTSEKYWERGTRQEALALMAAGAPIEGEKVTKNVTPYQIPGQEQMLTTYSTIVFPDENVVNVFASAGHNIVDKDSGEILGKIRTPKVILATANASEKVTA